MCAPVIVTGSVSVSVYAFVFTPASVSVFVSAYCYFTTPTTTSRSTTAVITTTTAFTMFLGQLRHNKSPESCALLSPPAEKHPEHSAPTAHRTLSTLEAEAAYSCDGLLDADTPTTPTATATVAASATVDTTAIANAFQAARASLSGSD